MSQAKPTRGAILSPNPNWMPGFSARYDGAYSRSARTPRFKVRFLLSVQESCTNRPQLFATGSPEEKVRLTE